MTLGSSGWTDAEIDRAADVIYGTVYPEARFKGETRGDGVSWVGTPRANPFRLGLTRAINDREDDR